MRVYSLLFILVLSGACASENDEVSSPSANKSGSDVDVNNIHKMGIAYDDTIQLKSIENQDKVENGEIVLTYPDGKVKAKGLLKNGKKEGLWESFHMNGNKWSSTFYVKGKANGHSITYYENGTIQYTGEYKDGDRVGSWEFYNEDGNLEKKEDY